MDRDGWLKPRSHEEKENMVKEVELQYGVLNPMLNGIPVYLTVK